MNDEEHKWGLKGNFSSETNEDTLSLIRMLSEQMNEPVLKSSARILIIITLFIHKKLTFTEIQEALGAGKGSLSNHIEKLEKSGLVTVLTVPTIFGPRVVVEITENGIEFYKNYSRLMKIILQNQ